MNQALISCDRRRLGSQPPNGGEATALHVCMHALPPQLTSIRRGWAAERDGIRLRGPEEVSQGLSRPPTYISFVCAQDSRFPYAELSMPHTYPNKRQRVACDGQGADDFDNQPFEPFDPFENPAQWAAENQEWTSWQPHYVTQISQPRGDHQSVLDGIDATYSTSSEWEETVCFGMVSIEAS